MMSEAALPVVLRPALPADRAFLLRVYASSREQEMAMVDWPAEQKAQFLLQQFEAQDKYYREHYPGSEFLIIEHGDTPVGRWYVCRSAEEIRIMDVALLPEYRGRGIGTGLISQAMEEARLSGRKVGLHVEFFNPAQRLYQRLGFRQVGETGVYLRMEWSPGS